MLLLAYITSELSLNNHGPLCFKNFKIWRFGLKTFSKIYLCETKKKETPEQGLINTLKIQKSMKVSKETHNFNIWINLSLKFSLQSTNENQFISFLVCFSFFVLVPFKLGWWKLLHYKDTRPKPNQLSTTEIEWSQPICCSMWDSFVLISEAWMVLLLLLCHTPADIKMQQGGLLHHCLLCWNKSQRKLIKLKQEAVIICFEKIRAHRTINRIPYI